MRREGQRQKDCRTERTAVSDWERHKLEQRGRKKEAQKRNRRVRGKEGRGRRDRQREKGEKGHLEPETKGEGKMD